MVQNQKILNIKLLKNLSRELGFRMPRVGGIKSRTVLILNQSGWS